MNPVYFFHLIELALLIAILIAANKQNRKVNTKMEELIAQAKANEDAEDAAAVLLGQLKAKLDAAGTDPAKLAQLSVDLGTHQKALAAAIVVNTPAAP